MNSTILKRLALALCLGIAPVSLAVAQTDTDRPIIRLPQGQQPAEGEATVEGEAGATVEGEADATAEGEAEVLPEGETGTAEAPAEEEPAETTAEGEAAPTDEEAAEAPAEEEEPEATAEGEATDETETAGGAAIDVETTGSISVNEEQRTQIAEVVNTIDIEPADVDFDISVGTTIPTTSQVALRIVPDDLVSVVPEFRGHLHFVGSDRRIVIVDPCTMRIAAIIA
jgi:hypothetical protein